MESHEVSMLPLSPSSPSTYSQNKSPKRKSEDDVNQEPKRIKSEEPPTSAPLMKLPGDLWIKILLPLTNNWANFSKHRLINKFFKSKMASPEIVRYLLSRN